MGRLLIFEYFYLCLNFTKLKQLHILKMFLIQYMHLNYQYNNFNLIKTRLINCFIFVLGHKPYLEQHLATTHQLFSVCHSNSPAMLLPNCFSTILHFLYL